MSDDLLTVLCGDVLEQLATLPDASVQCCVTSPPYWGLRDYGTGQWQGGDAECDHRSPTMRDGRNEDRAKLAGSAATNSAQLLLAHGSACGKCGAVKVDNQIGLEKTPDEFVAKLVAVFREVRRVLKDDGTCWINLGDSYAAQRGGTAMPAETLAGGVNGKGDAGAHRGRSEIGGRQDESSPEFRTGPVAHRNARAFGLKHKDLVGIPWLVAFALRADGWYLRQDIIWHKPSPMPESVTDRCTKAHEYIFLFSKSAKYLYDHEAIKEPSEYPNDDRKGRSYEHHKSAPTIERNGMRSANYLDSGRGGYPTRNKRSVWSVTNCGYGEAHFATYPPKLIEPCILAGTKPGDTVLDPFAGSGTTGMVAIDHGRRAVLIELNPDYVKLIRKRCAITPGLPLTYATA